MNRFHRTAAAVVAAMALTAAPALTQTATAQSEGVSSQVKQLVRDIDGKDRRLARLMTAPRTTRLADVDEAVLVAAMTADRGDLAALKAEAQAADSTYDARAVRRELRKFRVENYVLATNLARRAEKLSAAAIDDPEALAYAVAALAGALALTADSTRADIDAVATLLMSGLQALGDEPDEE